MTKASRSKSLTRRFILLMHQPDGTLFIQRHPQSWPTEKEALQAAQSKHSRYFKPFSVLRFVATTRADPLNVQLELFK